jgi:hypothetical protein
MPADNQVVDDLEEKHHGDNEKESQKENTEKVVNNIENFGDAQGKDDVTKRESEICQYSENVDSNVNLVL